ncbi:DUF6479 family protein [Streptomyces sp. NPDC057746]|uniref:DUF6479 family protein n=1 Tax=unclassified Streptomyces TaxID=2593676 RepID=UPI0033B87BF7
MTTASLEIAADSDPLLRMGPFVAGVIVVALLIGAFWLGARIRGREPAPPRPEEQPRLPEGGPVGTVLENREPEEIPRNGRRLTPHRLKAHGNLGSRPSPSARRRRWDGPIGGSGTGGGPPM